MPRITACGKTLTCPEDANLRQVLLKAGIPLYNGKANIINCMGIGTCGTCAVKIDGDVSPPNWKDKTRRALPPHSPTKNLRLACQTQVKGSLRLTKYNGFWGEGDQPVWTPETIN